MNKYKITVIVFIIILFMQSTPNLHVEVAANYCVYSACQGRSLRRRLLFSTRFNIWLVLIALRVEEIKYICLLMLHLHAF